MFKLEPRLSIKNCKFHKFSLGKCVQCETGYHINKDKIVSACTKDTAPQIPYKKTLVGSFLANTRWSISKKSFLGNLQKFDLLVNFTDTTQEDNFYEDFRENGSLEFFSDNVEHITHFVNVTSMKEAPKKIAVSIEYLRASPEFVLSLMLQDSPKNDKSGKPKIRLLQQDGYQIGLLLPQTIKPSLYYGTKWIVRSGIVFTIARILELFLTFLLILRPFWSWMKEDIGSLWLFKIVLTLQMLSFIAFVPTYCFRWFDNYSFTAYQEFQKGFLNLIFGKFENLQNNRDNTGGDYSKIKDY